MKLHVIAIGKNMPDWIVTGFNEYSRRLPDQCSLHLLEIPLAKRTKNSDINRIKQYETEQIIARIPHGSYVIALDEKGKTLNTMELAKNLQKLTESYQNVCLLIGGPDGLATACLDKINATWSLSALTLPHPLVRIILAEQIYRAWSILQNHPYHRT